MKAIAVLLAGLLTGAASVVAYIKLGDQPLSIIRMLAYVGVPSLITAIALIAMLPMWREKPQQD